MNDPTFANTFADQENQLKPAQPCVMVIFGATGDLTARKLMPALYNLAIQGLLPKDFACVAFARRDKKQEEFRQELYEDIKKYSRTQPVDDKKWKPFSEKIFYHQGNFDNHDDYERLKKFLATLDKQCNTKGNRVFYLATQPSFFPVIVEQLHKHKLVYNEKVEHERWSRVVIEKPFGHDLNSALSLQKHVKQFLEENQIYRIDHYLGKETVQNLLVFRFANSIFEPLWNNRYIDNIQITMGESIGIGTRGRFWEEAGILRDIVQNHLMQLMSLVSMEPPVSMGANAIRDEKVKVLQAIRPIDINNVDDYAVLGQYGPGYINGEEVKGYREEDNVDPHSVQGTFVALELFIDNWRWSGVPFYLRAGKRMAKRVTEIAITFNQVPGVLFKGKVDKKGQTLLVIRIQPDEGISLRINCKVPGLSALSIQPVKMDFRYGTSFGETPPDAYERLICDSMVGDGTLFARGDEVLTSWKLYTPLLEAWQNRPRTGFPNYSAGRWGPENANRITEKTGRSWRLV
ncbi:glucose-6-phosphate dehydrogenase [Simkania negevensis]|uniref:Glucose-6-phosphate 1-dehydrogenase n=1 Tax=Simkania negevensis TaxID=83561 RepID=A0ABS3AQM4_9BACT|nr:glucose-6-phosphate dehydrogenase [Simkania negevensis]